jgi:hypothetical protein
MRQIRYPVPQEKKRHPQVQIFPGSPSSLEEGDVEAKLTYCMLNFTYEDD